VVLEKDGEDNWTDHVRNEEVLLTVREGRNILHGISKRKANRIGHILRQKFLLRQVIEGKIKGGIEVRGRRGRRRTKLLDYLNPLPPNVIYMSYRTANLQVLHFKNLFNKCPY
jgi:metal-dependent hydrolase (beta-lactamase superfamily II)